MRLYLPGKIVDLPFPLLDEIAHVRKMAARSSNFHLESSAPCHQSDCRQSRDHEQNFPAIDHMDPAATEVNQGVESPHYKFEITKHVVFDNFEGVYNFLSNILKQ